MSGTWISSATTPRNKVYRTFFKHPPPDREAAFQDVYRRLHGGPFLGEE